MINIRTLCGPIGLPSRPQHVPRYPARRPGKNQRTSLQSSVVPWCAPPSQPAPRHLPLILRRSSSAALCAQGDEEEENVPPPYKYEGPREEGASLEISVTIEPEEGAEEGAEKKVRTKTITLLGARKGPGGKAAYPNGDAFEGSYFAGKRHGAAGSYTHTRHVTKKLARPWAAWLSGGLLQCRSMACHRPPHMCHLAFAGTPRSRRPPRARIRCPPTESTRARGRRVRRRRVRVRRRRVRIRVG